MLFQSRRLSPTRRDWPSGCSLHPAAFCLHPLVHPDGLTLSNKHDARCSGTGLAGESPAAVSGGAPRSRQRVLGGGAIPQAVPMHGAEGIDYNTIGFTPDAPGLLGLLGELRGKAG